MLRAINVAGHNKVTMADLQRRFTDLGYTDVRTYLQSGNVVFTSPKADPVAIEHGLDLGVKVILRTAAELAGVIRRNPFADMSKVLVTFLDADPAGGVVVPASEPDEWKLSGHEVFLYCPNGYGRSKLNNHFWERRLRVTATTRNWATVTKLAELAAAVG